MKEPEISVGIVSALAIQFTLNGHFTAKGSTVCDRQDVAFHEGGILWNGNIYHELTFSPLEKSCSFSLENVTIGIGFHWERQETQVFPGILKLVVHEGKIAAINLLPAEVYLESVISSEMNATAPLEFRKHMQSFHAAGCSPRYNGESNLRKKEMNFSHSSRPRMST